VLHERGASPAEEAGSGSPAGGYLPNRKIGVGLDTTPILGRAVKDTYKLLAEGMVKLGGG